MGSRVAASTPVRGQPEQVFRIELRDRQFVLVILTPRAESQNVGIIKLCQWSDDDNIVVFYTQCDELELSFAAIAEQVVLGVLAMECAYDVKIQSRITQCNRMDKSQNPKAFFNTLSMVVTQARPAPRSALI